MKITEIYYLVEITEEGVKPFIYRVEPDAYGHYVTQIGWLATSNETERRLGYIEKINKRGYTIITWKLSPSKITIFLSNTSFKKYSVTEFVLLDK
jgi:hypothetical protein